jgi:hypothetical protein
MTTLYKLTDQDGYTRRNFPNACLWGEGVSHSGTGEGDLCGPGYIHAYTHPLLAVLLNPIHANFHSPRLWEAEGEIAKSDRGLKVGCVTLKTIREMPLPVVTTEQHVRFAILCAKTVRTDATWLAWANGWLDGTDRTAKAAARAAAWAARAAAAAEAAAWAARAAAAAAAAAAEVAWTAARAAAAAEVAWTAAAEVAEVAWTAAAAEAAASARVDLIAIAEEACREPA